MAEPSLEGRKQVVLEGKAAMVSVDMAGGSIADFHLNDQKLNPLTWNYPEKGDSKPRTIGHFVCFDRWGQPSAQEGKNGMPFHGEATAVVWETLSPPTRLRGVIVTEMRCRLPIGGMELKRTMELVENSALCRVREEITNLNKLGRVYNIVQHPSIGPEYLDETVLVDTNAGKGFAQGGKMPTPEEPALYWPKVVFNGGLVDLRVLKDDHNPGVVSLVFADSLVYGWVTAVNPDKGLLIGYLWKLTEYPWLSIWRNVQNGKPAARGLEFGTTGLHQPFPVLVAKGTIFGRPLYEYIDAGETFTKSYIMFLARTPPGFTGVRDIRLRGEDIVITPAGENAREIVVKGR
jgi:hypothetical protein